MNSFGCLFMLMFEGFRLLFWEEKVLIMGMKMGNDFWKEFYSGFCVDCCYMSCRGGILDGR